MTDRDHGTNGETAGDGAKTRDARRAKDKKRSGSMRPATVPVASVGRSIFRKRGLAHGRMVADWPEIVGRSLAECSCPEKLTTPRGQTENGTLRIRVDGPMAVELQHLTPQIIERINSYFGYRAVDRLTIVRGPLPVPPRRRRPKPKPIDEAAEADIDARIADVEDDDLRAALASLGRTIRAQSGGR